MSHQAMSMEAMLDEERREVLALLEGPGARPARAPSALGNRSPSPYTNPRSPMRSMLDIGDKPPSLEPLSAPSSSGTNKKVSAPTGPVRSMLDVDNPPASTVRSMLDIDSPSPSPKQVFSNPSSPVLGRAHLADAGSHSRSMSDASTKPVEFGPRASLGRFDVTSEYQFGDIISTNTGQTALPKRVSMGNKGTSHASSMAHLMRGNAGNISIPGDRGRHYSIAGPSTQPGNKSKSPHTRLGIRSNSPANNLLSGRHLSPAGRVALTDSQAVIDMNSAYRRLSDAQLARSGGSLAEFGRRKKSDDAASGDGRLVKEYFGPDGEVLADSSDDPGSSDDEEEEKQRGRKSARAFDGLRRDSDKAPAKSGRQSQSLLAAAEEERISVASKQPVNYKYRSLLDEPVITITTPSGEKVKNSKSSGIHPATSFDDGPPSGARTPVDSDTEADITDIKRAQNLSFAMTPIRHMPENHRAIRIIYRGEYTNIVQDAEEEHRRLRKYVCATDLSEESTHALEWTIGTVLRDGDTLIAIYCVDEETGIVTGDNARVPDDPKAMREQAAAINSVASNKGFSTPGGSMLTLHSRPGPLALGVAGSRSSSPAPLHSERPKAEDERHRAVQDITERVNKLLRKTRLQVRVIVEVIHCKNPKHLITEVIDIVSPTLVILGSRGRSALKGVILGSFSNYLVTKSSVPVMVARKKLRKQSKYKKLDYSQVNNLNNPLSRSLANAKID